jgi:hypothetical protein
VLVAGPRTSYSMLSVAAETIPRPSRCNSCRPCVLTTEVWSLQYPLQMATRYKCEHKCYYKCEQPKASQHSGYGMVVCDIILLLVCPRHACAAQPRTTACSAKEVAIPAYRTCYPKVNNSHRLIIRPVRSLTTARGQLGQVRRELVP